MKQVYSYISMLVIAVFLCSTVLQYHHHDVDGGLDLLSFNTETCVADQHVTHIERTDAHHDGHSDSEECCTLKLSIQKPSRQINVDDVNVVDINIVADILMSINKLYSETARAVFPRFKSLGDLSACKALIHQLRAPPYFS